MEYGKNQSGLMAIFLVLLLSAALVGIGSLWYLKANKPADSPLDPINTPIPTPTSATTEKTGTLRGEVSFIGTPCSPQAKPHSVPPCDGPYSNYEIKVYDASGETIAVTAVTDTNGKYSVQLPPGKYLVSSPSGFNNILQSYQVNINSSETVALDLSIDTGIR